MTASTPAWAAERPALYFIRDREADTANYIRPIYRRTPILRVREKSDKVSAMMPFQFRVLRIQPDAPDEPIRCKLVRQDLFSSTVEYDALSYSWGATGPTSGIYMDAEELPFAVSPHLLGALRRLRNARDYVHVWVDAICIDQQNFLEKAEQIQIMAQIYSEADEVKVWLGDIDLFKEPDTSDPLSVDAPSLDLLPLLAYCRQISPWWTRLWVVQECAYARKCPTILCGAASASLEQMIDRWHTTLVSLSVAKKTPELASYLEKHLEYVRELFCVWTEQQSGMQNRPPLLEQLERTVNRQCGFPHDRIFAILSLVQEDTEEALLPDYRKSFSKLLVDIEPLLKRSPGWNEDRHRKMLESLRNTRVQPPIYDGSFDFLHAAIAGKLKTLEWLFGVTDIGASNSYYYGFSPNFKASHFDLKAGAMTALRYGHHAVALFLLRRIPEEELGRILLHEAAQKDLEALRTAMESGWFQSGKAPMAERRRSYLR